jgi:16S rRNA processing protein RimM
LSVRTSDGDPVGVVTDVLHYGQDLLVVRRAQGKDGECLVPFVKAIVPEVDLTARILVIDPPPGLLDPMQAE